MKKNTDNSIECSVALSYTMGSQAPIITASGKGLVSKRIKEIAEKNGITIIKDTSLANILIEEEIGACIPSEVYYTVASIFAFLLKTEKI